MVKSMVKSNKKWYIKGTDKEVKQGEGINYIINVVFDKYPNLGLEAHISGPIDDEILQYLEECDIIESKKESTVEPYTEYLKWIADVEGLKYSDVYNAFALTLQINPNAGLSILLKAISRKMLKERKKQDFLGIPIKVWIFNTATYKPTIIDVTSTINLNNIAYFITKEDIDKAIEICKPILEQIKKG